MSNASKSKENSFLAKKSKSPQKNTPKILDPVKIDAALEEYEKMVNDFMRSPTPSPSRINNSIDLNDYSASSASSVSSTKCSSLQEVGIEDDEVPTIIVDTADIDLSPSGDFCAHEHVIKEKGMNICNDCGMELYEECSHEQEWRYFGDSDSRNSSDPSRCQYRKSPEKGIKKDLERLGFPPDICQLADELYMLITSGDIKRSELRKGIQFACVLEAYKQKNKPRTPDDLQTKFFGLDRKGMSQGIAYYRKRCPREHFMYEDISAKHFIPKYMSKFNAKQEHIDKVIKLYEKIKDSCAALNRSNPQSASKSLVYYYLRRMGCQISPAKFGRIVSLSDIIVIRLSGEISRVLNSQSIVNLG